MMKVCLVLPTTNPGGSENYALRFAKKYNQHIDFVVVSKSKTKGTLCEQFERLGIPVHNTSTGYVDFKKLYGFYRFLKFHQFDAVCDLTGIFAGLTMAASKWAGVRKRVAMFRRSTYAFEPTRFKLWYARFQKRLVLNYATAVLSNSEYALDNFYPRVAWRKQPEKFAVIRNGINRYDFTQQQPKHVAKQKLSLPESFFVIGHVGRFDPAKNHEVIFKVGNRLKSRGVNVQLVFCGFQTDSDEFMRKLHEYGIENITKAIGTHDDVVGVLSAFDLFYFPSITEGQPNALLEAMIAGIPVLPSNIPSIREVIPESEHGKLLEPHNVREAESRIYECIKDPKKLEQYKFQEWAVNKFDAETNFKAFYDALHQ